MNQTLRLKCQRDAHLIPWKVLVATDSRRWPWKSEPAKECVTTHLPSQLALKMDGAIKDTVKVGRSPRWLVRLDARGTLDSVSIGRAWNIGQRFDWTRVEHWTALSPTEFWNRKKQKFKNGAVSRTKKAKFSKKKFWKAQIFQFFFPKKPKFSNFFFWKTQIFSWKNENFQEKKFDFLNFWFFLFWIFPKKFFQP